MTQQQHDLLESVYEKLTKDSELLHSLPAWMKSFPTTIVLSLAERAELLALLDCEFDYNTVKVE